MQRVNIQRATLKDLEYGIKELEKRGYELIKRDELEFENKNFEYREKRFGPQKQFKGWSHTKKYKAVLERIYYG